MVIQVYWIRDAVKVKQAVFLRDVQQAMGQVVFNLDRMRIEERLNVQRKNYLQEQRLKVIRDSLNQIFFNGLENIDTQKDIDVLLRSSDKANRALTQLTVDFSTVDAASFLINKKDLINTQIANALAEKKIYIDFEYGIYSRATNSMILQKTGKFPEELTSESYVRDLSPLGPAFGYPNVLLLYFPNENRYVLNQLWLLLFISIFLFIVIILSFYFSIRTINKHKKLSVMKNDFINNMTHEFKTPISTISLACEALKDDDIKKSESLYDNYIGVIDAENKRLGSMAEQILQTAIMDKGHLKLKQSEIDIHELIQKAIDSKSIQIQSKNGKLESNMLATNPKVIGDKIHLTNVVINLLDNAIKYNISYPEILINTVNKNGSLLIRVKDNGIGISNSDQKRIFEKLYRVTTGNLHDFKGFGLGLSYVKAIVEMHHGDILVESEPGKGSIFTIKLPSNK
jgi:two-component system phosphate regulon sensor histidine kinase PhoR